MTNAFRTQSTVRSSAEALNNGQLALLSIERAFRNGSSAEVADAGKLLVVRTASDDEWECQAWYFDPDNGGSVYTTSMPTRASIDTTIAASNWTLLATDAGAGLTAIFSPGTVAGPSGDLVTVTLNLRVDGQADVALTTSVAPRLISDARGTCFP